MKIDKVIMSCDDKRYYLDFWEPVSKVWKLKFNIHPVLILFGDKKQLNVSEQYGTVVEFKTNSNILPHIQAQWARYWYPITEPDTTWLISDIDMFPMSKEYFINSLINVRSDAYINLNADKDYFPACYNGGTGKTFKEVLELSDTWEESINEINVRSKEINYNHTPESFSVYEPGQTHMANWGIDESFSCAKIKKFADKSRIVRVPRPGGFCQRRLDRASWKPDDSKILSGWYNDCHSIRPYNSGHKPEIDRVVNLILGSNQ
jgi:hypothetical protein